MSDWKDELVELERHYISRKRQLHRFLTTGRQKVVTIFQKKTITQVFTNISNCKIVTWIDISPGLTWIISKAHFKCLIFNTWRYLLHYSQKIEKEKYTHWDEKEILGFSSSRGWSLTTKEFLHPLLILQSQSTVHSLSKI